MADDETLRQLEEWLQSSPENRRAFRAVGGAYSDGELAVDTHHGHSRKLQRAPFYMRQSTRIAAGGCALALVAGVLTIGLAGRTQLFGLVAPADAAVYVTGLGEIRTIVLPDGTRVTLDAQSVMKVAGGTSRTAQLTKGRAHFQIAKGAAPFVVAIPGGTVRSDVAVLDVSLLGARARVSTLEGTAEMTAAGDGTVLALSKGQAGSPGDSEPVVDANPQADLWVKGMLTFRASPLGQAAAEMNRYNVVNIDTTALSDKPYKITGTFPAKDPKGFAEAAAAMFALRVDTGLDGSLRLRSSR